MRGTFYGIGLGPGESELVTIKAQRILREVHHIYAPRSKDGRESIALRILKEVVGEEVSYEEMTFPMIREERELKRRWGEIVQNIEVRLERGEDLALVCLGDPLLYGTYAHIIQELRERDPEVSLVTVPGITSFSAASAKLNQPQVLGEERLAIIPATTTEKRIEEAIKDFDTIVFLKVSSAFLRLLSILKRHQLLDCSTLITHCGLEREEVVYDLNSLKEKRIEYLSLIITRRRVQY